MMLTELERMLFELNDHEPKESD